METLKKRSEFLAVAKGGRVHRRAFVVQGRKNADQSDPRVGYTVTKKTGNSVMRSRIKRRLRAAVADLDVSDIPQNADFVLVARDNALSLPFPNLVEDLKSGLRQVLEPAAMRSMAKSRRRKPASSKHVSRKQG